MCSINQIQKEPDKFVLVVLIFLVNCLLALETKYQSSAGPVKKMLVTVENLLFLLCRFCFFRVKFRQSLGEFFMMGN